MMIIDEYCALLKSNDYSISAAGVSNCDLESLRIVLHTGHFTFACSVLYVRARLIGHIYAFNLLPGLFSDRLHCHSHSYTFDVFSKMTLSKLTSHS